MKIDKEKIKEVLFKVSWTIAKHAFFTCLILFLMAFSFGLWLFNKSNAVANTETFEGIQATPLLKQEVYKDVLDNWEADEERYEQADYKEYIDPFLKGGVD